MRVDYKSYIESPEWRKKADAAKRRAGYRCQLCNRSSKEVQLNAHHRTYERLGRERPEDITVLCRRCHKLFHEYIEDADDEDEPDNRFGVDRGFEDKLGDAFDAVFFDGAIETSGTKSLNHTTAVVTSYPKPRNSKKSWGKSWFDWFQILVLCVFIVSVYTLSMGQSSDVPPPIRTPRPTAVPTVASVQVVTVGDAPRIYYGPSVKCALARYLDYRENVVVTGWAIVSDTANASKQEVWYRLSSGKWLPSQNVSPSQQDAVKRTEKTSYYPRCYGPAPTRTIMPTRTPRPNTQPTATPTRGIRMPPRPIR